MIKGPSKAGVMWLRVKTEEQWQILLTDLRTTSRGEDLFVLSKGAHMPPWPTTKLVLSYAANSPVAVKVSGDCYNLKAFLPAVGFEWRKSDYPYDRPTEEEKLQKLPCDWICVDGLSEFPEIVYNCTEVQTRGAIHNHSIFGPAIVIFDEMPVCSPGSFARCGAGSLRTSSLPSPQ